MEWHIIYSILELRDKYCDTFVLSSDMQIFGWKILFIGFIFPVINTNKAQNGWSQNAYLYSVNYTSTYNSYFIHCNCWIYYLIQFDGKSMVKVQLTGYQFCYYFFMCLSAKKKYYWHINNTTKGINVLQIL